MITEDQMFKAFEAYISSFDDEALLRLADGLEKLVPEIRSIVAEAEMAPMGAKTSPAPSPRRRLRRASPECQRKPNWDARFKKP